VIYVNTVYFCYYLENTERLNYAGVAQLVVRDVANVEVASSNLVTRSMLEMIYVFFAAFVLGFVYSFYIRRTATANTFKQKSVAAGSGTILYLLGAVVIISYVENPWMLIPTILGDFFGTLLQLVLDKQSS
jgi:hypothetical protein